MKGEGNQKRDRAFPEGNVSLTVASLTWRCQAKVIKGWWHSAIICDGLCCQALAFPWCDTHCHVGINVQIKALKGSGLWTINQTFDPQWPALWCFLGQLHSLSPMPTDFQPCIFLCCIETYNTQLWFPGISSSAFTVWVCYHCYYLLMEVAPGLVFIS